MFKPAYLLCASLVCFTGLYADQPDSISSGSETQFFSDLSTEPFPPISETESKSPKKIKESAPFKSFTGKVKGKKVRLRTHPDLESSVAKELQKGEYLLIVDHSDDFWVVEAPHDLKAYIFRSFVLDNVVEGSRVNIRLHPSTESPIIGHVNAGQEIHGTICDSNHKWLEIEMPKESRFYVSKSFIENVGGPEVREEKQTRAKLANEQFELAKSFAMTTMQKEYQEVDFEQMTNYFQTIIREYSEFTDLVSQAKEELVKLQEQFIDKKIAFHESAKKEKPSSKAALFSITDKMKIWEPVEEALYQSWLAAHDSQDVDEYRAEQRLAAETLSGIVEPYLSPVKSKPGDFILKKQDLPVCYIYSTTVNLQNLVGRNVSLIAAPRPNNHFAFPAYFVLDIEE